MKVDAGATIAKLGRYPEHRLSDTDPLTQRSGLVRRAVRALFSFEAFIVLFLHAGLYKEAGVAAALPLDSTVFFLLLSLLAAGVLLIQRRGVDRDVFLPTATLVAALILCLASTTWTAVPGYGLDKAAKLSTLTAWCYLGPILAVRRREQVFRILIALLFMGFFVTGGGIYNLVLGLNPLGVLSSLSARYTMMSRLTGTGLMICMAFAINRRGLRRVAWLIPAAPLLLVTFGSGGRAPILAVGIPLLLAAGLSLTFKPGSIGIRNWSPALLVEAGTGFLLLLYAYSLGFFDTLLGKIFGVQVQLGELRPELYAKAIDLWMDYPLFGAGLGGYAGTYGAIDSVIYPHSLPLEVLSELGLVGLALFSGVLLLPVARFPGSWRTLTRRPLDLAVVLVFANALISAMLAGDLNDNRALFFAAGLLAALGSIRRRAKRPRPEVRVPE
jgi:O-antigen ligase